MAIGLYAQTFLKLGLWFGYLLYQLDRLNEKVFDLMSNRGWYNLAMFIRDRGTKTDHILQIAGGNASALTDEYCERYDLIKRYVTVDGSDHSNEWYGVYECFYGLQLYKLIFCDYGRRFMKWFF